MISSDDEEARSPRAAPQRRRAAIPPYPAPARQLKARGRGAGAPRDETEAEAQAQVALKAARDRVAAALAEADAAERSARQRVLAAREAELAAAAAQRTATAQRAAAAPREEDAGFQPMQWEQQPAPCYAPPPPHYYPRPQALQHAYAQQGPVFSQTLFDMLSRTAAGSAHEATATAALRAAIEMGQHGSSSSSSSMRRRRRNRTRRCATTTTRSSSRALRGGCGSRHSWFRPASQSGTPTTTRTSASTSPRRRSDVYISYDARDASSAPGREFVKIADANQQSLILFSCGARRRRHTAQP